MTELPLNVVLTDGALSRPEAARLYDGGHRLVILGDDTIAMSLAQVVFPRADRIWANLNRSCQVQSCAARVAERGGCDLLVVDPGRVEGPMALLRAMRLTLAFLPQMRPRAGAEIVLLPRDDHEALALADFRDHLVAAGGVGHLSVRMPCAARDRRQPPCHTARIGHFA